MKEKLRSHFLSFGPKKFVLFTVVTLIVTDILNSYYLKLYWLSKNMSSMMVALASQRMSVSELTPDTIVELEGFVNNVFYFFLLIIVLNNLFFYVFYLRKKLWAQGYVLFYTLTAALFAVTFIVDQANLGVGWMIYNFLTIPLYVYLYLGVKILKPETTNLEHGKKGR